MKGTARPSWTEGRHRWLYVLKMRGVAKPQGTSQGSTAQYCRALGWTAIDSAKGGHVLTNAGRDQLERWDAGDTAVAPRPKPQGFKVSGMTAVQLATALLEMGEGHAIAVYEALHAGLFGTMPPPASVLKRYHDGGLVGKLPDDHVPRIIETGQTVPVGQCPIKVEIPPPTLRDGAPTECDGNGPEACDVVRAIEAQTVQAPQFGIRHRNLVPSIGQLVGAYTQCDQCHGRGTVRHSFQCPGCKGAGKVKRTVEL